MKMTETQKAQAIIVSSYILFLIDGLVVGKSGSYGSTINLKQKLMTETRSAQNVAYVVLSNKAWSTMVDSLSDQNLRLVVGHAVERLYFDNEEVLTIMYGPNFVNLVWRFTCKQLDDQDIDNEIIKETNLVTKELTKCMQKVIFDYLKG